jgi:arginase
MGAGPERLLDAGLSAHLERQGHRVDTVQVTPEADHEPAEIRTAFELMRNLSQQVKQARVDAFFPLVLAGNCSTAAGTLSGLTPGRRAVFWFDAHGDCNTPDTTTTGFLDGTALAIALGQCWHAMAASIPDFLPVSPAHALLLGTRDLDPFERELIATTQLRALTPDTLRSGNLDAELTRIATAVDVAYVHCDLDVLDPSEGGVNSFQVAGGIHVEEVANAIAAIGRAVPIAAAAITAYAPEFDTYARIPAAAFRIIDAVLAASSVRGEDAA